MKRPTAFVIGLFLVGASSVFSQSQVSILSQQATATFGVTSAPIPAVVGAPYSGEQTEEHVQTLADGTHITRPMGTIKTWRDSEGRIRTERPMRVGPRVSGGTDSPVIVEISDPVAGVRYTLDIENKVAHRPRAPRRPRFDQTGDGSRRPPRLPEGYSRMGSDYPFQTKAPRCAPNSPPKTWEPR